MSLLQTTQFAILAKMMVFRSVLKKLILVEGSNLADTTFK